VGEAGGSATSNQATLAESQIYIKFNSTAVYCDQPILYIEGFFHSSFISGACLVNKQSAGNNEELGKPF
jgi:hypothetical protein